MKKTDKLQAVLSNPDIIIVLDKDGNYKNVWTNNIQELVAPVEEISGKNVEEILPSNIAKQFKEYIELAMDTNKIQKFRYKLKLNKGVKLFEAMLITINENQILSFIKNVSDKEEILTKLIKSEKYYRAAFENTGTATFIINEDTTIAKANSRFIELSGYNKEEIEGKMSWTKVVSPDYLPQMKKYHKLRRKNRDKAPNKYEFDLVNKNGDIKNVIVYVDVIPETKKSIASLLDITDRKEMENKLRKSEKRYRNLFENFPAVIWEEDLSEIKEYVDSLKEKTDDLEKYFENNPEAVEKALDMIKVIDINKTSLDFYNADSKKEIYDNIEKLFSSKAKDVFKDIILAIARNKTSFSRDSESKTIDGKLKDVRIEWKIPEKDNDYSRVYLTTFDVSERKLAERVIKRQNAYFQQLFDKSPEGIVLLDNNEHVIKINDSFEKIFGYSQREIEGKRINDLIIPEEKREEGKKFSEEVKNGQTVEKESERKTKSGKKIYVSIKGYPITYEGQKLGVYAIYNDITVRKREEEKIKYLSFHDQLTNLYNRRYFEEERDRLDKSRNLPISIIVADMDGLKKINDNFGHKEGDRYLKRIADIISRSVRESDIVARIGGDEFAVLLPGANLDVANKIEERILENSDKENETLEVPISISTGSATKNKANQKLSNIFKIADRKMYEMKENKKTSKR